MRDLKAWEVLGEALKRECPITSQKYPRIIERFQYLWDDREICITCFDNLLIKDSIERQGFPPEVVAELLRLRKIYEEESRKQPKSG